MGWVRAIPLQWRIKMQGSRPLVGNEKNAEFRFTFKGKEFTLRQTECRHWYAKGLEQVTPTAQKRWEDEVINFGLDWPKIYTLPYKITPSTKLQSLQFRITHRFFPTKRYLFTRQVVDEPFCDDCGLVDTLQHFFVQCPVVRQFWQALLLRLNSRLPLTHRIAPTDTELLFGMLKGKQSVNAIILIAKQFIAIEKFRDGTMNLNSFNSFLNRQFDIGREIAFKNRTVTKFKNDWHPFITNEMVLGL